MTHGQGWGIERHPPLIKEHVIKSSTVTIYRNRWDCLQEARVNSQLQNISILTKSAKNRKQAQQV